MTNAYNQILLSPESHPLTTINTHRGLFQYNRLCFGIASAPGIFQRAVEDLLRGIPGVCVFFYDILVSGSNAKKHNDNLGEVLRQLQEAGLKLYILLSVQLVLIKFNTWVILLTLQVLNLLNRS